MNYLKFSHSIDSVGHARRLLKARTFDNKVVVVNGFNGSGKTLLSPIISAMQNVEAMTFAYELEWCASFLYAEKLEDNAFSEFVKLYVDHTIYNQMMSRSVNFRPSDLSSVLCYRPWWTYIRRLFREGDNAVTDIVRSTKPILSLTTCHLLPVFPALSSALGRRLLFIEMIRDPVFMFRQLLILHETVIGPKLEKDFTLRSVFDGVDSTYLDFYSSNDVYDTASKKDAKEIVVSYLERVFNFYFSLDFNSLGSLPASLIVIPFEKFVLSPLPWIEDILKFTGSLLTTKVTMEMSRQKVPRTLLTDGRNVKVYKRFGWSDYSARASLTVAEEIEKYRGDIRELINNEKLFLRLVALSDRYNVWVESKNRLVYI